MHVYYKEDHLINNRMRVSFVFQQIMSWIFLAGLTLFLVGVNLHCWEDIMRRNDMSLKLMLVGLNLCTDMIILFLLCVNVGSLTNYFLESQPRNFGLFRNDKN